MSLEYDNSAFYYFALTLLFFYLVPGTWFALSEIYLAFISGDKSIESRTTAEKAKAAALKKQRTGATRLKRWPFILNICCLVVSYIIFFSLLWLIRYDGEVNRFDPYTILNVEHGASTAEVKKAYRKLSLQFHPDKNIGNKAAEEMFMKVAKAYESLTDETAKENYEKFGNPDGKQALEVSIGLPKIILENPKVVLVLYLLVIVVVIPIAVGINCTIYLFLFLLFVFWFITFNDISLVVYCLTVTFVIRIMVRVFKTIWRKEYHVRHLPSFLPSPGGKVQPKEFPRNYGSFC